MEIAELTAQQVNSLILEQFGVYLELKEEGHYFLFRREDVEYISWSLTSLPAMENAISYGLLLCAYSPKKKLVYPSIVDRVSGYPTVEIQSVKKAIKFSRGENVALPSLQEFEQKQIIVTHNGYPLAFGQVLFGEFQPLIDIGWYLREAEKVSL
ncbi:MAG: hypothetical protein D6732_20640 [Methanobacteriota archaeon]|nr:MAG: hypothetical protein D6732_20640 [Euryarchaeota archaeon]